MRLTAPRIPPLSLEEADADQRATLEPYETKRGILNIYRTLARKPQAAHAFLRWGRYVLRESTFDSRLRELVILRIGWLCRSGYEWAQHSRLGRQVGLTAEDIARIKLGPDAAGWSPQEALLLRAADELTSDHFVSSETWAALQATYSQEHLMDLVYIVGHYTQVCMILNSFGVQLEDGQHLDRDLLADPPGDHRPVKDVERLDRSR